MVHVAIGGKPRVIEMSTKHIAASLLAAAALTAVLVVACNDDSPPSQAPISTSVLDSAASFLGAATGKYAPVTIDNIVFINSTLGINNVSTEPQDLYGDLWVLVRDAYGAPVLDANGCVEPVASTPVQWPDGVVRETVPMVLEEFMDGDFKCAPVLGYEQYTIELEIGRLNMVRTMATNPDMFGRALREVIDNINAAVEVKTDPAGRLVLVTDELGVLVENTIDSPRENLAMYYALLKNGRIAGYGPETHEGGVTTPPQWLEISPDLDLGDLAYLRDGTPGRDGGVSLINGYADLSAMWHSREQDYQAALVSYVQYIADPLATCKYEDQEAYAYPRVFGSQPLYAENIAGFAGHADDARQVIVFMHDVIQDMPETELATLPAPAGDRIDAAEAAAVFLGAASNKSVPLTVDGLVFINTVLGFNDLDGDPNTVDFAYKGEIYGDLWELERTDNGEPVLVDVDGDMNPDCPLPLSSDTSVTGPYVPMELDAETGECIIVAGYEEYVIELELGRLNGVRAVLTNPTVLDRALYDVVTSINNSTGVKLDLSGRLAYGVDAGDGTTDYYQTVDSPRAGLALYAALMRWGKLEGPVQIRTGEGVLETINLVLDEAKLTGEGLGYLKTGNAACQADPADCGASRLPSGYVDYSAFSHNSQDDFDGVDVSFVERTPEGSACAYVDVTDGLWERVLESDATTEGNIAGFVAQAEDTRTIIQFIHTVIQDPLPAP